MSKIPDLSRALYNSGCLKFGTFKLKSGVESPYYIDLVKVLSSPADLCTVADIAAARIKEIMLTERIDKLASIELKGALILPSIACRVHLPCAVVRKEEKSYGVVGRIVGSDIVSGEHILFFDDVISEGLSKLEAMKPLEEAGARVKCILVVVDREQSGARKLEELGYKAESLAKISQLVAGLFESQLISSDEAETVLGFIKRQQLSS